MKQILTTVIYYPDPDMTIKKDSYRLLSNMLYEPANKMYIDGYPYTVKSYHDEHIIVDNDMLITRNIYLIEMYIDDL